MKPTQAWEDSISCSFCGKPRDQVHKVIAGPGVFICDECVDLCNEIIIEDGDDEGNPPPWWPWREVRGDHPV